MALVRMTIILLHAVKIMDNGLFSGASKPSASLGVIDRYIQYTIIAFIAAASIIGNILKVILRE